MNFLKFLLDFLKSLNRKEHFTGVADIVRTQEEKDKDYLHEERLPSSPPQIWFEKQTSFPTELIENQHYTSSCVSHAATMSWSLAIEKATGKFIRLSKMFVYRLRSNYPYAGSNLVEAMNVIRKIGSCLYDSLPNTYFEDQANAVVITNDLRQEAATTRKEIEYYKITNARDIDLIASLSAQGIGVSLLIFATDEEWSQEYPKVIGNTYEWTAPIRHAICTPSKAGFIENERRYVTVLDSAHFGGLPVRHLSDDFISKRVFTIDGGGYFAPATFKPNQGTKPVHTFPRPLKRGETSAEVVWLQKVLLYEGLLPEECVIGTFGPRTEKAVIALQEKHRAEILTPVGLYYGTGNVGPSTLKWLNQHYSS